MTISQQLYANNARSTLASGISGVSTTLDVATGEGAKFPSPTAGQYFLVTIEVGTSNEIVMVTARSGDTLTITRAQEGTVATAWPVGALVEMRITRDTLARFARLQDRVSEVTSVDNMSNPANSDANSYLMHSTDDGGAPVLALKDTSTRWKFVNYSKVLVSGTVSSATTTQVTSTAIGTLLSSLTAGQYIIQFTSGTLAGIPRAVTSSGTNTASWATTTGVAATAGDSFEIYQSDWSVFRALEALADDPLVFGIIFGE